MFKVHVKRVLIFGLIGFLAGLGFFFFSPKVYEGRSQVLVANDARPQDPRMPEEVTAILSMGLTQSVETEVAILGGENVFFQALQNVAQRTGNMSLDPNRMTADELIAVYRMSQVVNPERTRVAEVRVRAYDPELAAELTNEIVTTYNEARLSAAQRSVVEAADYLNRQLVASQDGLAKTEQAIRAFKSKETLPDYVTQNQRAAIMQADMTNKLNEMQTQLAAVDREVGAIRAKLKVTPMWSKSSEANNSDSNASVIEQRLAEARAARSIILARYHEDHPSAKENLAQINSLKASLQAMRTTVPNKSTMTQKDPVYADLERALATSEVRRQGIHTQIIETQMKLDEHNQKMRDMPAKEQTLIKLERDRAIVDANYRKIKSMLEDLNNRTNAGVRAAQILFTARPDDEPVAPEFWIVTMIGLLGGLTLGLLFSFTKESMKPRVYDSVQLGDVTGLPVLPGGAVRPLGAAVRALEEQPKRLGRGSERFRFLALQIAKPAEVASKSILFTGVGRGCGTSYSTLQTARAMASAGSKVLLVDGDLRRGSVTKAFKLDGKPGLTDVLGHNALPAVSEESTFLHKTAVDNLDVLPAGMVGEIPISGFSRDDLHALLGKLSEIYEHILVDTPPCDLAADAAHLAPFMDEIVLFVHINNGDQQKILNSCRILESAGARSIRVSMTANKDTEDASA